MKVKALVFSKNRPMQLSACLESFLRHASGGVDWSLDVLYSATTDELRRQYEELAGDLAGRVNFVQQQDFRGDVLRILFRSSDIRPRQGPRPAFWTKMFMGRTSRAPAGMDDAAVFLVDDCVFVRSVRLDQVVQALRDHPRALGFSFRLGKNITSSYVTGQTVEAPRFMGVKADMLMYNWTDAEGDFGYPLELSSSAYRVRMMRELLERMYFENPNTLESVLATRARRYARTHPMLLCPETSLAFSLPLNRVQAVYENRSGMDPDYSVGELARRFDQGMRIDVAALDGFVPRSCHQEVPVAFVPKAQDHARN